MIEVLKQALEALEKHYPYEDESGIIKLSLGRYMNGLQYLRQAIAELESQQPVTRYCCHSCFKTSGGVMLDRMIVCPDCGNKRCPKASNHALKCTNSNEPNQAGSVFTHPPQRKPLTDEQIWQIATNSTIGGDLHADKFARAIEDRLKEKNCA